MYVIILCKAYYKNNSIDKYVEYVELYRDNLFKKKYEKSDSYIFYNKLSPPIGL